MVGKRQFSLGFLLFELSCIAVALGMFRVAAMPEVREIFFLFFLAGSAVAGIAIGAWFGRPILVAVLLVAIISVALIYPTLNFARE